MGWITTLLPWLIKYLPSIIAMLSALFGTGAALIYQQSWNQHVAASKAGGVAATPDDALWYQYVVGSAAAGVGVAGAFAAAQSRQSKAHAALEREEAAEEVAKMLHVAEREQTAVAYALKAKMAGLSPACQAIVTGK